MTPVPTTGGPSAFVARPTRFATPPVIDGRLDEPVWQTGARHGRLPPARAERGRAGDRADRRLPGLRQGQPLHRRPLPRLGATRRSSPPTLTRDSDMTLRRHPADPHRHLPRRAQRLHLRHQLRRRAGRRPGAQRGRADQPRLGRRLDVQSHARRRRLVDRDGDPLAQPALPAEARAGLGLQRRAAGRPQAGAELLEAAQALAGTRATSSPRPAPSSAWRTRARGAASTSPPTSSPAPEAGRRLDLRRHQGRRRHQDQPGLRPGGRRHHQDRFLGDRGRPAGRQPDPQRRCSSRKSAPSSSKARASSTPASGPIPSTPPRPTSSSAAGSASPTTAGRRSPSSAASS